MNPVRLSPSSWARIALVFTAGSLLSCTNITNQDTTQQAQVTQAFATFKEAIFSAHASLVLAHLDRATLAYLQSAAEGRPSPAETNAEVGQLVHQAIKKMTPGGIRPGFSLQAPLQRVLDQGLMNTHEFRSIQLGPVTVTGKKARAELSWDGIHTTYQLCFVEESGQWKIDLLGVLPYAELGLRLGRTLRNETETQQVDRLVSLIQTR